MSNSMYVRFIQYLRNLLRTLFQTDKNYHRALVFTAVMTSISHLDPDFGTVFSIEAVNEPIMNPNQTPGYGDCQCFFHAVISCVDVRIGI